MGLTHAFLGVSFPEGFMDYTALSNEQIAQELIALEQKKKSLLNLWRERQMLRLSKGEITVEKIKSYSPVSRVKKDWFDKLGF